MSKIVKMMDARRARVEMIIEAMRDFEQSTKKEDGQYQYAYLAGFYMQQLLTLAADRLDSTENLVRELKSLTKIKEIA